MANLRAGLIGLGIHLHGLSREEDRPDPDPVTGDKPPAPLEPVTLIEARRLVGHRGRVNCVVFLPDGRRFLFAISLGPQDINGTYLGSLDGAEPHRILEGDNAAVFAPPDSLLAARQGNLMAWRVDPATMAVQGDPVRIATALGDIGVSRAAFSVSNCG